MVFKVVAMVYQVAVRVLLGGCYDIGWLLA